MSFSPFSQSALTLQATTGPAGFALQNATPAVITWTAPNDGKMHRAMIVSGLVVTSTETGGQIDMTYTLPTGAAANETVFNPGFGTGTWPPSPGTSFPIRIVGPGQTISLVQQTALTAGAGIVYAEIWGS